MGIAIVKIPVSFANGAGRIPDSGDPLMFIERRRRKKPMTPSTDEKQRKSHLVDTEWLEAHLQDPRIRIVDMRGYVLTKTSPDGFQTAEYTGARAEYEQAHIPGAVYLDWTSDIVDPSDPIPAQVAPSERIAQVLGDVGIGDDTLVIAYDHHPASQFATRLWWVLKYYGHDQVRVLDGGWNHWIAEGRPVTSERTKVTPVTFRPRPRPQLRATAEEVLALIGRPEITLVDARDEGQYTGTIRRGLRGGHIPGAVNLPREALIQPDGRFRPSEELQSAVEKAGIKPTQRIIAYCNGGVAATVVLFALSLLGYASLANYDGSWNEWGNRLDLPVEQGTPK
jgi:thiosulfate/3-mercaptopyruvate sulfurtransferase